MALPDLFPLRPTYREMIWGGRGLEQHLNKDLPPERAIGESWEVSAYEGMDAADRAEDPEHGRTILIDVGARGLLEPAFRLCA